MRRRSTLVALLVALVVMSLGEAGARAIASRVPGPLYWDSPFSQDKAGQIARLGQVDVVFMGSSIVNAGVEPGLVLAEAPGFGSGYNAALPSTSPQTWAVWSRDLILTDLCPAVLVIGVAVRDYSDTVPGAAATLSAYETSAGRSALYGGNLPFDVRAGDWSALVRIRSRLREPDNLLRYLVDGSAPGWPRSNLTESGRFRGWDTGVLRPDATRDARLEGLFDDFSVGGVEAAAIEAMVADARRVGIEPVLVRLPVMRTELAGLLPHGMADMVAFEHDLADLAEDVGAPLLVFEDFDDRPELYGDLYHMNLEGTRALSTALGAELSLLFPAALPSPACPARPAEVPR